jgi:release factor glutamine methyltransferase
MRDRSGATIARDAASTIVARALVDELATALADGGIDDPRAEARDIIAAVLDAPRFWASLHADAVVSAPDAAHARAAARTRASGAPFAYAVGRAAFRHLTLEVDERVLIPRQETELLIDLVRDAGLEPGGLAIDVGTGSGCIALALAIEGRFDRVIATDISRDALAVAQRNAARLAAQLRAPIAFAAGAGLTAVPGPARVIVSNPPYISFAELGELPASVRDWEPPVALSTGGNGLATTFELIESAARHLERGGLLAFEVDVRRASLVAERLASDGHYHDVQVHLDLTGRERFVIARRD